MRLDELPEITFGELRVEAIPDEDLALLKRASIDDPKAEMMIAIQTARVWLSRGHFLPSKVAHTAQSELNHAADLLRGQDDRSLRKRSRQQREAEPIKKRKIFNGIGKLLGGVVAGGGNVLIAAGTIVAPNPATAYGAIASGAAAIATILAGVGDL